MPLVGANNSSLPRPAISFCIPSGLTHSCAFPALCSYTMDFETPKQQLCSHCEEDLFPRNFFLPSLSQNFRNWLLFFSFGFNLYFFFFWWRKMTFSDFFFLTLKFIFFLYFGSIWKLISDHLLRMGLWCERHLIWGTLLCFFFITILPYLILVLWLHFIKLLFIGRGVFLTFPLSILQF